MSDAKVVTELGFEIEGVETLESKGRWPDLTRLRARRPGIAEAAAWMLGRGMAYRAICEALSLSPCTVRQIAEDPELSQAVVTQNDHVTAQLGMAVTLGVERLVEQAAAGKLTTFDVKLLHDMLQVRQGGATSREERVLRLEVSPQAEAAMKLLAGMGLEAGKMEAMPSASAGTVASLATGNALSMNGLRDVDAILVSNDASNDSKFNLGGEGVA